jgi:hypothetical protein
MAKTVKQLIKSRNLRFLHPLVVEAANGDEIAAILKSVAYYRNFKIFKTLYTLLYKSRAMTIDHYKEIYKVLVDYDKNHPSDYFVDGFSRALAKSNEVGKDVKTLYGNMIYNILRNDENLFPHRYRLEKAVKQYYETFHPINIAVIKKSKVLKINSGNIVKMLIKLCNY